MSVFEVLSPGNSSDEMVTKFHFYDDYGVEEYYLYDRELNDLAIYTRRQVTMTQYHPAHDFTSPRLGIRFDLSGPEMVIRYPDGRPFLSMEELDKLRLAAEQRAEDEAQRADDQTQRADDEAQRADDQTQRAADATKRADDQTQRAADAAKRADDQAQRAADAAKRADEQTERADRAERRIARQTILTQKVLLQQATTEEQEELRALLAAPIS